MAEPLTEPMDTTAERARLTRLLKARKGKPGWADNVRQIEARLAALDAQHGH